MEIPKIVEELLANKAQNNNTIDLDAYANGLLDMYQALQIKSYFSIGKVVIIKDCIYGHEFENGEEVLISDYDPSNGKAHWLCRGKNWSWWISEDEAILK